MRSLTRNQQKAAYEKFKKLWRAEKKYQAMLIAKDGQLPKGVTPLKRRPTFSMWLNITKTYKAQQTAEPIEVQEFVDETSLDWDEEEATPPGDQLSDQQAEVQGKLEQP
jgi:hypothetical protein